MLIGIPGFHEPPGSASVEWITSPNEPPPEWGSVEFPCPVFVAKVETGQAEAGIGRPLVYDILTLIHDDGQVPVVLLLFTLGHYQRIFFTAINHCSSSVPSPLKRFVLMEDCFFLVYDDDHLDPVRTIKTRNERKDTWSKIHRYVSSVPVWEDVQFDTALKSIITDADAVNRLWRNLKPSN